MREIDVVAAEPALGEEKRDIGVEWSVIAGVYPHAGEPRRQRQSAQLLPLLGDAAIAIDRTELAEQCLGLIERRARRRVEEGERRRISDAPMRQIEREAR